ncbi:MAG: putative nicotinate-nucleotide adenylyltransferase [Chitinophagales bacterium]|nr:MAG: putative nicotinate-nucleotide adenylyltransferase [Chitinophagales bacterium]
MKTGLFFGSFNPIHTGHLIIAHHFSEFTDLNQIWFMVSPHNPLKKKSQLLDPSLRLELVKASIADNPKFICCSEEFHLPQPSYTIQTLNHLTNKYPDHNFVLIAGSDTLQTIKQWKQYKDILRNYTIYVYPRHGHTTLPRLKAKKIRLFNFPLLHISATYIRKCIKRGKSVKYLVPDPALHILQKRLFSQ